MDGKIQELDLIVVGGGPAGSVLATLVAMQGHKVLLLERERFPRYQIGESLLPSTVNGICALVGVSDEIRKANFVRKQGGTFRWGREPKPWTFNFGPSAMLSGSTAYAYQVERMRFDAILLRNAARRGVDVREQHTVTDLLLVEDRVRGVVYRDPEGKRRTAAARFIADASGHQTCVSKNVSQRVYSRFFQNVALFTYFRNGKRLPPPSQGNILCEAFDDGWFWYIPLSDTLTSVGVVIAREHAQKFRDGYDQALAGFIQRAPTVRDLLSDAVRETNEPYCHIRVRKDYSYCNTGFWRPGAVLVGDAACFVDPVFSSGVHLATYSALLAARSINTLLRGDLDEQRCFTEFERRYLREFSNFYEFLMAFYDMDKDHKSYFWEARKVLHTEERANEAFVRLVAGFSENGEPLYKNAAEYFDARRGIGKTFEKVYANPTIVSDGVELNDSSFDTKAFMESFERSSVELLTQSRQARRPIVQAPLFGGGLVPSADGFHWCEPVVMSLR